MSHFCAGANAEQLHWCCHWILRSVQDGSVAARELLGPSLWAYAALGFAVFSPSFSLSGLHLNKLPGCVSSSWAMCSTSLNTAPFFSRIHLGFVVSLAVAMPGHEVGQDQQVDHF